MFSESEPCVEEAGAVLPSVQSDFWPTALLSFDSDPHLPGFPGPGFPVSTTAELVRDLDASVRVSDYHLKVVAPVWVWQLLSCHIL